MRCKKNLAARLKNAERLLGVLVSENIPSFDCGKNLCELLNYNEIFRNNNPVRLEIGFGKGGFIIGTAKANPHINFIGLEKCPNTAITALENAQKEKLPNLRFIIGLAEYAERIFPAHSIEQIYLNFSCPFPKTRYRKHRLTHENFLSIYRNLLSPDGFVSQKTDSLPFFEFSLKNYEGNGWKIYDLNNNESFGEIKTEYETLFSGKGFPIYCVKAAIN
jgi:tRNA (guanine-N7-)-methyltransferase